MKILFGQKTALMPFDVADVPDWAKTLEADGMLMGQSYHDSFQEYLFSTFRAIETGTWLVWTVYTKNLNQNRKLGFACVFDIQKNLKASMLGMMNKEVARDLPRRLKEEKITYAEDSLRALLTHLYTDINLHKVEATIFKSNRPSRKLVEKVGFKKEGELRDSVELDGKYENVISYGLLKEEFIHV